MESRKPLLYLEPFSPRYFNLATSQEPVRVRARRVTPDGHRLLGEGVALGRDFLPGDDQAGRNQVALLSNRLWRSAFGADPGIIGRIFVLTDSPTPLSAYCRRGRLIVCLPISGCRSRSRPTR